MIHVLIVDDHKENRDLLKLMLEVNGYRVTDAGNGLEALAAARSDPPDVVVSDVLMPKMDGFALCRAWMQDEALKAIPFIFYSATYVRPDDERFALALGAVRYLIKPLDAKVFLKELAAVLQQWAGRAAPSPSSPLEDATSHALHESALARKVEDKMVQLEAANRRLQESEARFRGLTEMSSDYFWESDAEHRLISHSSARTNLKEATALRGGAQIGKPRWEIPYLSPDEAGWRAHRMDLDAHRPFRNFEFSRLGRDGKAHYVTISGNPVFDATGAFIGYSGVGTDITERKHAEDELKRGQEELRRFRLAMDAAPDAIYLVDRATMQFIDINAAACRIRGQTRERILALGPQRVLVQSREELEKAYDAVIASGSKSTITEVQGQRRDGSQFTAELARSAYRIENSWIIVTVARDITERKRVENALARENYRNELFLRNASDGIHILDSDGYVLELSDSFCTALGYWRDELIGAHASKWDAQLSADELSAKIKEQIDNQGLSVFETQHRRKDGKIIDVQVTGRSLKLEGKPVLFNSARDISERKLAERKIQRLTQLYAGLSQCNEAIVRCRNEEELFAQICRVAVQFGGMKMAWIGLVDPGTKMVNVAARFGEHADEYLQGIEVSLDADSPLGRGSAGIAIREKHPVWYQDLKDAPRTAPWHVRRAHFPWGGMAALPLYRNGAAVGVLTLYAGEINAFDDEARSLLVEMANDISFALDNFAREAARQQAENDLRAAEEQFRGLVEQSLAGVYIVQRYKFAYVNPRLAEILGYASAEELIGEDALTTVAEKDRGMVLDNLRLRVDHNATTVSFDFTAVRKDGTLTEVGMHGATATHQGRPAIIGLMQDISEKKRAEEQIQRYVDQLKIAFMSTVEVATSLSEMRDPYTAGHERHVGEIAASLGAELGLEELRIEGLRVAGFLHDIGKITIPAEILSKPGKLSPIEYQLIKRHPQSGYDVLKDVKFPWPVAEVALQHHERMDGNGYPQGLKGEAILLEARIMAVADVMEAMSSHRPYRPGLGVDAALAEIERGRGTAYDTGVADACLRLFREKNYKLPA